MWARKYLSVFLLLCCLCSPLLFSRSGVAVAHASGSSISLAAQSDTITFPKYIDFSATANDTSGTITGATIFITFNVTFNTSGEMLDTSSAPEQHGVTISHPGQQVALSWRETTNGSIFFAPGTRVQYYWQVQDSAGNTYTGSALQFTTTDSRFTWQHQTQGLLQVNWYNQPQSFGAAVVNEAAGDMAHISRVLGGSPTIPITLWIYANDSDFRGALPPNTFEWVGGIAYPLLNEATIVASNTSDTTLIRDMPHELTHIIFGQLTQKGIQAPTWFNEGLAVYNQLYHEQGMTDRLNQALQQHALLRLKDLQDQFPADSDLANLAYAQSWNLVGYMFKAFGGARMQQLIKHMNNPATSFDQDLTQSLGVDQIHLENQWRLSLSQPGVLPNHPGQPKQPAQPQQPGQPLQPKQPAAPASSDTGTSIAILFGSWLLMAFGIVFVFIMYNGSRRRQQWQDEL